MGIILIVIIISWILHLAHVSYYNAKLGKTVQVGAAGIVDLFFAPIKGFENAVSIIVFVLVIGGYISIGLATRSLDAFAQRIPKWFKKNRLFLIPLFMIFFSILGTIEGFAEESLGYYLLLIPLMLIAGYDVFVGVLIILIGAGVGVMGSIFNPFAVNVAFSSFPTGINISTGNGLVWRIVAYVVFTTIGIGFTMLYAHKVERHPSRSVTFATYDEDKKYFLSHMQEEIPFTKKRIVSLILFLIFLLAAIFYIVNWDSIFNINFFENAGAWIRLHIPYITGTLQGVGSPNIEEATPILLIGALVIAFLHWGGEEKFINDLMNGIKGILPVALIIGTAAGLSFILQTTNMNGLVISALDKLVQGVSRPLLFFLLFLVFVPLSFLIPSSSGFAKAIFPIVGSVLGVTNGSGGVAAFIFAIGWVNLFTPTSGVVMGGLSIARMEYSTFMKGIWPLLLTLFLAAILLLEIGSLLPTGLHLF